MMRILLTLGVLLAAILGARPGLAQDSDSAPKASFSQLLNVDALVDNYSRFLARKYNLNEEQDAFTQKFLRERAHQFLQGNQQELFTLVDRLFEVRGGGDMRPEELADWGRRVQPVYEKARELIVASNNEWRGILNDEQKRIHDDDLRLMNESFASTEDQLARIASGEMTVDEFRQGNRAKRPRPTPPPREAPRAVEHRAPSAAPPPGLGATPATSAGSRPRPSPISPNAEQPIGGRSEHVPPKMPPPEASFDSKPAGNGLEERAAAEARRDEMLQRLREKRAMEAQQQPPSAEKMEGGEPPPDQPPPEKQMPPDQPQEQPQDQPEVVEQPMEPPPMGPRGRGLRERGAVGLDFAGQWEQYVRDFIHQFKLNEGQSQRALLILKDCQEQGERVIQSRREEITRLDRVMAAAGRGKDNTGAAAQRERMLSPLSDIFEKQLKPRLDRLLTTAQKKAGEASAEGRTHSGGPRIGRAPREGRADAAGVRERLNKAIEKRDARKRSSGRDSEHAPKDKSGGEGDGATPAGKG